MHMHARVHTCAHVHARLGAHFGARIQVSLLSCVVAVVFQPGGISACVHKNFILVPGGFKWWAGALYKIDPGTSRLMTARQVGCESVHVST